LAYVSAALNPFSDLEICTKSWLDPWFFIRNSIPILSNYLVVSIAETTTLFERSSCEYWVFFHCKATLLMKCFILFDGGLLPSDTVLWEDLRITARKNRR